MKTGIIALLTFINFGRLFAQNEPSDYFTKIYPSPTGKKVLIVECVSDRESGCLGPISTRLYNLPLDCNNYITFNNLSDPLWDSHGRVILNTKPIEGFSDGYTYVNTIIEIYDTLGFIFDTIEYAFSPICEDGKIFFCREYNAESKTYFPQIFEYDFKTKKEKLIHGFDSIYTFWPEQVDCLVYPEVKSNLTYPKGIVCILYSKDNYESSHTAVIDPWRMDVVLWKEGYHFNSMTNE